MRKNRRNSLVTIPDMVGCANTKSACWTLPGQPSSATPKKTSLSCGRGKGSATRAWRSMSWPPSAWGKPYSLSKRHTWLITRGRSRHMSWPVSSKSGGTLTWSCRWLTVSPRTCQTPAQQNKQGKNLQLKVRSPTQFDFFVTFPETSFVKLRSK